MNEFERQVRQRLKSIGMENKIYLKENPQYEIFQKHNLTDEEINLLFDMKKISRITANIAFDERINAEIDISKTKKIKIIFQFDPIIKGEKKVGKVGIITAFVI